MVNPHPPAPSLNSEGNRSSHTSEQTNRCNMDHKRGPLLLALLLLAAASEAEETAHATLAKDHSDPRVSCERLCQRGFADFPQYETGEQRCPDPCPACPQAPRCPDCRPPVCPAPVCPPLPPIPPCPTPIVNLTCPEHKCPQLTTNTSSSREHNNYEELMRALLGNLRLKRTKVSWFEANETCSSEGGHLVIPNSKAEQFALMGIMNLNEITEIHVGFDDNTVEGYYTSILGEPMDDTQMRMWAKNQPSGGRRENCAVMYNSGKMHDWPCSTAKFAFVCEMSQ